MGSYDYRWPLFIQISRALYASRSVRKWKFHSQTSPRSITPMLPSCPVIFARSPYHRLNQSKIFLDSGSRVVNDSLNTDEKRRHASIDLAVNGTVSLCSSRSISCMRRLKLSSVLTPNLSRRASTARNRAESSCRINATGICYPTRNHGC